MRTLAVFGLVSGTVAVAAALTSPEQAAEHHPLRPAASAIPVTRPGDPLAASPAVGDMIAIAIPVQRIRASDLIDSWDRSRAQGRLHRAIDIAAPAGTPVVAAMDGRIEKLFTSDRGGHTIYQRSAEGRLMLYYAHLQGYRRGLAEGDVVRRGQVIATVGTSGNADPAFPHLHFQMLKTTPGADWRAGAPINPYPLLAGRGRVR